MAAILKQYGFELVSQRGSHMKMQRIASAGLRETVTIPAHRELDTGTCRAILRQASRFIPFDESAPHFYSE